MRAFSFVTRIAATVLSGAAKDTATPSEGKELKRLQNEIKQAVAATAKANDAVRQAETEKHEAEQADAKDKDEMKQLELEKDRAVAKDEKDMKEAAVEQASLRAKDEKDMKEAAVKQASLQAKDQNDLKEAAAAQASLKARLAKQIKESAAAQGTIEMLKKQKAAAQETAHNSAASQATIEMLKKQKAAAQETAQNLQYILIVLGTLLAAVLLLSVVRMSRSKGSLSEALISSGTSKPFEGTWKQEDGTVFRINGGKVLHDNGKEEQIVDVEGQKLYTHRMSTKKGWFQVTDTPAVKGSTGKVE